MTATERPSPAPGAPRRSCDRGTRGRSRRTFLAASLALVVAAASPGWSPPAAAQVGETGTWSDGGWLEARRVQHTASLLPDGRVLLAGGDIFPAAVELYDPTTRRSTVTLPLGEGRQRHTATTLVDGRVLVAGGQDPEKAALTSAEIFDSADEAWAVTGSMAQGRESHTATLLADGRVLVVGGVGSGADFDVRADVLASAEVYDPELQSWETVSGLATPRWGHSANLLPDGRVLVAGGQDADDGNRLASVEIYDPALNEWTTAAPMGGPRGPSSSVDSARLGHTASVLPDGTVLVVGGAGEGAPGAEVYTPETGEWQACSAADDTPDCPSQQHTEHTANVLQDGTLLVVGGRSAPRSAERYDPVTGQWWAAGEPDRSRIQHTATVLDNGHVVVAGGWGNPPPPETADVYSPDTVPAPTVTAVDPTSGSVNGGTEVTITGEHLDDAVMVHFGDHRAPSITQDSPTQVRAITPSHAAEEVSVTVTTPGGTSATDVAGRFVFVAADGAWEPTGSSEGARRAGTVVLDGRECDGGSAPVYCGQVLVVGDDGNPTTQLYDPETGTFSSCGIEDAGPACPAPLPGDPGRKFRGTTTVLDGPACRGEAPPGYCGNVLAVSEQYAALYDPETGGWQACDEAAAGPDCPAPIPGGSLTNTIYKTVLIDGPECRQPSAPAHCGTVLAGSSASQRVDMWVYDPTTGQWSETAQPTENRRLYALTLVDGPVCEGQSPPSACGDVLIASGMWHRPGVTEATRTAELYDPATGQWRDTAGTPPAGRQGPAYTTLPDGRVLLAGGAGDANLFAGAEIFDPTDESWQAAPPLPLPRGSHSAVTLQDGRVLVAGGEVETPARQQEPTSSALIFTPGAGAGGEWSYTDSMSVSRTGRSLSSNGFPLVTLPDGRVLAAGGTQDGRSAELYALVQTGSVAGRVADASSEAPIAGATVTVTGGDGAEAGQATTGADGTYEAEVDAGDYTVTVAAAGYEPASENVTVAAGETTTVDFALTPVPGSVAGTVTDAETGGPIAGATVTVTGGGGAEAGQATTANDGTYEIAGLAAGAYTVSVAADGYEPASEAVAVARGETATVDVALTPQPETTTGTVAGSVTDAASGDPVPGAQVTVAEGGTQVAATTTAADGGYEVSGLDAGDYTVTADAAGYEPQSRLVTVVAGETVDADFALRPVGGPGPGADPCPEGLGAAPFTDRDEIPAVHRGNVDCAADQGIVQGFTDGRYGPALPVRRDQMASFIARMLDAADVALPAPTGQRFTDVDSGSPHDAAIHRLAAAEIVQGGPGGLGPDAYGPAQAVRRDQMASFLLRAAAFATGADLASQSQAFTDVPASNTHVGNVNGAAEAGLAQGVGGGLYEPASSVRRDQMATFVIRLLTALADGSLAGG